jgi:hypothetical protein
MVTLEFDRTLAKKSVVVSRNFEENFKVESGSSRLGVLVLQPERFNKRKTSFCFSVCPDQLPSLMAETFQEHWGEGNSIKH